MLDNEIVNGKRILSVAVKKGSIRDDPYWTSRVNSLQQIELFTLNKVSLV